jgi:hypothetical protein
LTPCDSTVRPAGSTAAQVASTSAVPSVEPSFTTITGRPSSTSWASTAGSVLALANVGATTTGENGLAATAVRDAPTGPASSGCVSVSSVDTRSRSSAGDSNGTARFDQKRLM